MKRKVVSVNIDMSVGEAAALIIKKKVGTLPVVDAEGTLVGVTTTLSIMQNFFPDFVSLMENIDFVKDFGMLEVPSQERLDKVGDLTMVNIMGKPVGVEANSSLLKSLSIMEKHRLWDLPVLEEGKLVGIASRVDIARAFLLKWTIPQNEAKVNS
jgi:CBS domain-containing protein